MDAHRRDHRLTRIKRGAVDPRRATIGHQIIRTILDSHLPPMLPLLSLRPGDEATVAAIHADSGLRQRLTALGFRPGRRLALIRNGAFAGPLHVRLGTTDVILRRKQAAQIQVLRVGTGQANG
jgi:ferrous iron transport protein A